MPNEFTFDPTKRTYVEAGKKYLNPVMPFSEVCMSMKIAGKPMVLMIKPLIKPTHMPMVQLYTVEDEPFSSSITTGEAGLFRDVDGIYGWGLVELSDGFERCDEMLSAMHDLPDSQERS